MTSEIIIEVVDPTADLEQLDRSAHALREELLEIPEVESVTTRAKGRRPRARKASTWPRSAR